MENYEKDKKFILVAVATNIIFLKTKNILLN